MAYISLYWPQWPLMAFMVLNSLNGFKWPQMVTLIDISGLKWAQWPQMASMAFDNLSGLK